jgi:hypothetical protein
MCFGGGAVSQHRLSANFNADDNDATRTSRVLQLRLPEQLDCLCIYQLIRYNTEP